MNMVAPGGFPAMGESALTYAIGDIHGRADLLAPLLQAIREDRVARGVPMARMVFLGDYVDRGSGSRQVIDQLLAFAEEPGFACRFLLGNHEDAMLDFLDGRSSGSGWGRHGAETTLRSFGVEPPRENTREAWAARRPAFAAAVPDAHRRFLDNLELIVRLDDLIFVHAGIRAGVALDQQSKRDLLWIRSEFLTAEQDPATLVVHGHTPQDRAYAAAGRLCLDSGAYVTGRLTGAVFQGGDIQIIEASGAGVRFEPYPALVS